MKKFLAVMMFVAMIGALSFGVTGCSTEKKKDPPKTGEKAGDAKADKGDAKADKGDAKADKGDAKADKGDAKADDKKGEKK